MPVPNLSIVRIRCLTTNKVTKIWWVFGFITRLMKNLTHQKKLWGLCVACKHTGTTTCNHQFPGIRLCNRGKHPPKPLHVDHLCMLRSGKLTAGSPENHQALKRKIIFHHLNHPPPWLWLQNVNLLGCNGVTTVEPAVSLQTQPEVTHTSAPRTRTRLSGEFENAFFVQVLDCPIFDYLGTKNTKNILSLRIQTPP